MCHSGNCDRADTYVYFWRSTRSVRLLVSSRSMDRDRGFLKRCTLNVLCGLHLIFCIFGFQEIKRLRQRPHFFVRLSHFFSSQEKEAGVCPRWLYCPFSQSHYHIVSSASCVLSPQLVVQWNLGIFRFSPPPPPHRIRSFQVPPKTGQDSCRRSSWRHFWQTSLKVALYLLQSKQKRISCWIILSCTWKVVTVIRPTVGGTWRCWDAVYVNAFPTWFVCSCLSVLVEGVGG